VRHIDALLLILIPDNVAQIRLRRAGRTKQRCKDSTENGRRDCESLHFHFPYLAGIWSGLA
jgi:hypothetical protein